MSDNNSTPAPAPALDDWTTVNGLAAEINKGGTVLSTHSIRHLVAQAGSNGLEPYVRRLNRKILLSKSGFATWLNGRPPSRPVARARR